MAWVSAIRIIGDEPLEDGMHVAVRIRRDFAVTDAPGVLAAARAAYRQVNTGCSQADAEEAVSSAADAIFVILDHAGILGPKADAALAGRAADGLTTQGQRAQVTIDEQNRLRAGPDCFTAIDVFALPPGT